MAVGSLHSHEAAGPAGRSVRFGTFSLDMRTGELRKAGVLLRLQHRPSQVLALLVSHPGQLLTREEIQQHVWPEGTFVDFELGLNTCIRQVRAALRDDAETPRFIETMPRRGYRFIAPVESAKPPEPRATDAAARRTGSAANVALAAVLVATAMLSPGHSSSSGAPALSPTCQRLTFRRGAVSGARFGPDGQVVYEASWDGAGPAFYEGSTESAGARRLDVAGSSIVSVSRQGEISYLDGRTLARVSLAGGAPKRILADVLTADSTADGADYAVARMRGDRTWIEYPVGRVLCEAVWPSHLRISPSRDGVALIEHPVPGDDRGIVSYVDRRGHKKVLSSGWASIEGLAWRADAREIWFTAARVGADNGLHAVDLHGRVRDLLPGMGRLVIQDVAGDGKVLLVRGDVTGEIRYSAEGSRAEQDLTWLDLSTLRDLSHDGKTILFEESGDGGGSEYGVFVRRTDRSPAVRIGQGLSRALSPDGRWALVVPARTPDRLEAIPVGEGERRVLHDPSIRLYGAAQWLPGSRAVVFTGVDAHGVARVYRQDLLPTVAPPQAITPEGGRGFAQMLAPDGKQLLATCEGGYCLYGVEGPASVHRVPGVDQRHRPLCWGDNGKAIYFCEANRPVRLVYRLDLATGRLSPWKKIVPPDLAGVGGLLSFLTTPDERAYAYGYLRTLSQLYLMSHLS